MRFIHTLIDTVISRMQPMMKGCQKGETPFRLRPLRMTPSRMTPTTVLRMAPWPPPSLVPPMTVAVMASISRPIPVVVSAVPVRAVNSSPAMPARPPIRA